MITSLSRCVVGAVCLLLPGLAVAQSMEMERLMLESRQLAAQQRALEAAQQQLENSPWPAFEGLGILLYFVLSVIAAMWLLLPLTVYSMLRIQRRQERALNAINASLAGAQVECEVE